MPQAILLVASNLLHLYRQTAHPPTHLLFYCETPPQTGGETPIVNSVEAYHTIQADNPAFMELLEKYGLRYIRYLPEENDVTSAIGRGWKATYQCSTKEEAETVLREQGSEWQWLEGNILKTITAVVPAIRENSGEHRTNEKTFFNSLVAAYKGWNDSRNQGEKAVVLGDEMSSLCDKNSVERAANILDEISVAIPWQQGDILLLDNRTTMHSRHPFTGNRRVLASLARDPNR